MIFLNSKAEYGIKIDNDEVANANNDITVFINCAIKGENKETIGVVGVGFRVKNCKVSAFRVQAVRIMAV